MAFPVTNTITVGSFPWGVAADNAGHVFVVNNSSNNVSVISTATMAVTNTITVGVSPRGVAADGAGHVFVANNGSSTVSVISTATMAVTNTITVGSHPLGVAADGAGHVFVANNGSTAYTVSVISTATMAVTNTINIGSGQQPLGVAYDGAGHVFVTNVSNAVSVIDTATMTVEASTISVLGNLYGVAADNAGHVFVVNNSSNNVSVISTSSMTVTNTLAVGTSPFYAAFDGAGHVFVTDNSGTGGNRVSVIDTATMTVEASTIPVGSGPVGIASDRVSHVFVANGGDGTVSVIQDVSAPSAPTLISPVAGAYVDATQPTPLTATYNSTDNQNQDAYAQHIKTSAAPTYSFWNAGSGTLQSTIVWNPITTAPGANWTVTLPANALANGNTYNWSDASQEAAANLQGPFAADATFNAQAGPTVTLTGPSGSVVSSQTLAQWTTTPGAGAAQTTYRLVLYTAAQAAITGFTPGTSPSTWDSGMVASSAQQAQIGYTFVNGSSWVLYLQVTETGGQTSTWVSSAFTATFGTPATPGISCVYTTDPATGLPHLSITVQGHDNLFTAVDASFETGVGTWTAGTNWTVTQDTTQHIDGSASLKCVRANTTPGNGYGVTAQYTVLPSTLYTGMVSIYADSTSAGKQYSVMVQEAPSGLRTSTTVTLGAAGTWTPASVQVTTGPTTTAVNLWVSDDPQTTPAAAQAVWVDEAGIFPGNVTGWHRGGLTGSVQVAILRDDGLYVRGASQANPVTLPAGTQTIILPDAEVVPTVQHTYTCTGTVVLTSTSSITSGTAGPTAAVSVPGALGFWEFDPTNLASAVNAQMTAYSPQITEQATAHLVLGQATPNVISSVMGGVDGEATFATFDAPTYKGLTNLLISQRTVFISDPFGDNQGVTYVRFGPQTGGMSGGSGLKAKSATLMQSSASSPRHTLETTWTAQPRPPV